MRHAGAKCASHGARPAILKKIPTFLSITPPAVRLPNDNPLAAPQPRPLELRETLMKFVCLGYIDEAKFASIPPADAQRMMEECFAYDDELRRGGHFLGGEALDSARKAVTLSTENGELQTTDGPFSETKEVLGGILLLEAADMQEAVALMSKHPGVKMGPFEIRPADDTINELIAQRNAALTKSP